MQIDATLWIVADVDAFSLPKRWREIKWNKKNDKRNPKRENIKYLLEKEEPSNERDLIIDICER